jgi:hypothetical protein
MTYKITEYFSLTKELVEREANAEEALDIQAREQKEVERNLAKQARAQAKAELLERLGITADEAKLLLA